MVSTASPYPLARGIRANTEARMEEKTRGDEHRYRESVREHYRLLQQYNSVLAAPVPLITLIGVWQSSAIQPDLSKETLCQERYEAPLFTESKARAPKAFEAARAFERDEEQEMNEHNLGVVRHAEEHYKTLPTSRHRSTRTVKSSLFFPSRG